MKLRCALRVRASLPRLPRRPVLARFLSLKQERVKSDNEKEKKLTFPPLIMDSSVLYQMLPDERK